MEKEIYLVAAVSNNGVIGIENRLPWHFSADLKKFKELTMGSTVIMGRRTFESIGKPLPNRENFVLTGTPSQYQGSGSPKFFSSLRNAVDAAPTEKVFIMGGESVYKEALKMKEISGIYLTRISKDFPGDVHFPKIPSTFKQVKSETLQDNPKIEFIYLENEGLQNL